MRHTGVKHIIGEIVVENLLLDEKRRAMMGCRIEEFT